LISKTLQIQIIKLEDILSIIPLLIKLNNKTSLELLKERVFEIAKISNYECEGLFVDEKLAGITWFLLLY
jgi:hypothetical protein